MRCISALLIEHFAHINQPKLNTPQKSVVIFSDQYLHISMVQRCTSITCLQSISSCLMFTLCPLPRLSHWSLTGLISFELVVAPAAKCLILWLDGLTGFKEDACIFAVCKNACITCIFHQFLLPSLEWNRTNSSWRIELPTHLNKRQSIALRLIPPQTHLTNIMVRLCS